MRVVFMGTPDFAAASLRQILSDGFEIVGVFTQPDKPKGRGMAMSVSPVKELALAHGIPVFQPEKMRDGTALQALKSLSPDILAVVAYGRILPPEILEVPVFGAVNVHGSLLPKYRGAAPIQWAVLNGDQEYWNGLPLPSPGDLPDTGMELGSPALQSDSLPSELATKITCQRLQCHGQQLPELTRPHALS